jgi:hemolysin activation/secretion protein
MYSSSSIVQNEGILLGGLTTLRGFDENSLVWKSYILETIETHLFFEKEGYFSIFSDYCSGMQWTSNSWKNKNYLSLGFGIVFKAKSGIFQLYYALGKSIPGNFNFTLGKIHAGYSVKF